VRSARHTFVAALVTIPLLYLGLSSGQRAAAADQTIFVDCVTGADSATGGQEAPWKTLAPVSALTLTPGAVIQLKKGCTWDTGLKLKGDGTASSPVTLNAYGSGAAPVLSTTGLNALELAGAYTVVDGLKISGAQEAGIHIANPAHHSVVSNTEITNTGVGVRVESAGNLLTRINVHDLHMIGTGSGTADAGAVGFQISGVDNEVSYSSCSGCKIGSSSTGLDGGFAEVKSTADRLKLHHNKAENTDGFLRAGGRTPAPYSLKGARIFYNVLVSTQGGLCLNAESDLDTSVADLRFENNTIVNSAVSPKPFLDNFCRLDRTTALARITSEIIVRNNVFVSNREIAFAPGWQHSNNIFHMANGVEVGVPLGAGDKIADPLFVDIAAKDFHLLEGSPAIGAGLSLGYKVDFDGKAVSARPDIGAFAFRGTGSTFATSTTLSTTIPPATTSSVPGSTTIPVPTTVEPGSTTIPVPTTEKPRVTITVPVPTTEKPRVTITVPVPTTEQPRVTVTVPTPTTVPPTVTTVQTTTTVIPTTPTTQTAPVTTVRPTPTRPQPPTTGHHTTTTEPEPVPTTLDLPWFETPPTVSIGGVVSTPRPRVQIGMSPGANSPLSLGAVATPRPALLAKAPSESAGVIPTITTTTVVPPSPSNTAVTGPDAALNGVQKQAAKGEANGGERRPARSTSLSRYLPWGLLLLFLGIVLGLGAYATTRGRELLHKKIAARDAAASSVSAKVGVPTEDDGVKTQAHSVITAYRPVGPPDGGGTTKM